MRVPKFLLNKIPHILTISIFILLSFTLNYYSKRALRALNVDVSECESCHGSRGVLPVNNSTPKLAKQNYDYLVQTLIDFKYNSRKEEPMKSIAGKYSEKELAAFADYFSKQSCK